MPLRAFVVASLSLIVGACSAPSTSSAVPTRVPATSAAPTAVATASEPTASAPAPSALRALGFAILTAQDADVFTLPGRDAPRLTEDVVSDVVSGEVPVAFGKRVGFTRMFLAEGPVAVDGHDWWRVTPTHDQTGMPQMAPQALLGWIDAGPPGSGTLAPVDPCPPRPPRLSDLVPPAATWALGLGCFSGEALELRGWWAGLPGEPADDCEIVPAFLCTTYAVFPVIRNWEGPGTEVRFNFHVAPSAGVTLPQPGRWLVIAGRFDDPLAATCPRDDDLGGLGCRSLFIASDVRPS